MTFLNFSFILQSAYPKPKGKEKQNKAKKTKHWKKKRKKRCLLKKAWHIFLGMIMTPGTIVSGPLITN